MIISNLDLYPTAKKSFNTISTSASVAVIYNFNNLNDLQSYQLFLKAHRGKIIFVSHRNYSNQFSDQLNKLADTLSVERAEIIVKTGQLLSNKVQTKLFQKDTQIADIPVFNFTYAETLKEFIDLGERERGTYKLIDISYSKRELVTLLGSIFGTRDPHFQESRLQKSGLIPVHKNEYKFKKFIQQNAAKSYLLRDNNMNKLTTTVNTMYKTFIKMHPELVYPNCFLRNGLSSNSNLELVLHFNTFFDKIYVLNMLTRTDRWNKMKRAMAKHDVYNAQRFLGLNGNQEPHYGEWKSYIKTVKNRKKCIKYQGSWAILKSMKLMLLDAKKNNYDRILVLQDDLMFHKNFLAEFQLITTFIPPTWKLLYLGASQHIWTHVIHHHSGRYYHPNGYAEGAFAVAINSNCYNELLEQIELMQLPVDSGALCHIQRTYRDDCYVVTPNLIIADIRDSDIRPARGLNTIGTLNFKWDLNNFDIDD